MAVLCTFMFILLCDYPLEENEIASSSECIPNPDALQPHEVQSLLTQSWENLMQMDAGQSTNQSRSRNGNIYELQKFIFILC